eukprot:TRINITY_DN1465_c0_g2_i1.p2 TRINITY_DN1465_c0_g2~~TRINITY_DN1465_c0_g2_i1.p2  ORF type:complete len:312 (-),score=35.00 TRINITY_DN1465_c0_g2_i1:86-994(-)
MDMLATCHGGLRGIYLWSNQYYFGNVLDLTPSEKPINVELPGIMEGFDEEDGDDQEQKQDVEMHEQEVEISRVYDQLDNSGSPLGVAPKLMTLSLLPASQWQNLAHLDLIQARNKPKEPPKQPEAAPFFLPTVQNFQGATLFQEQEIQDEQSEEMQQSRIFRRRTRNVSQFEMLLSDCHQSGNFDPFVQFLRNLSPLKLEQAVQDLVPLGEEDEDIKQQECQLIIWLFDFLVKELETNRNSDFIVGFISLVLRLLGNQIIDQVEIRQQAKLILQRLEGSWSKMSTNLQSCLCSVNWLSGIQS